MSESLQGRSEDSLRHEYSEAVQNVRHYSNLRFAIFTIFFAVIGGVGYVAFGKGHFDSHAAWVARIAGFAVVAVFWVYQERAGRLFEHHRQVAVNLEHALGYTQYIGWPSGMSFPPPASVVNRLFFVALTMLWVYATFAVPPGH